MRRGRGTFLLWCLVLVATRDGDDAGQRRRFLVHGAVVTTNRQRERSLKKSRDERGDYYFANEPNRPIILVADFVTTNSTAKTSKTSTNDEGGREGDPIESKEEAGDGGSEKRSAGVNATVVLSKLKGDAPNGSYSTSTAKGDEKIERGEKPAARTTEKSDHRPSKSPSSRSKGSTKSTPEGKNQRKKKIPSDDSTKSNTSSSDKKSKLKLEKEVKDETSDKESKSEKGGKKPTKQGGGEKQQQQQQEEEEEVDTTKPGSGLSETDVGKCASSVATAIMDTLPHVTALNPTSCCDKAGAMAAYVTHATYVKSDDNDATATSSGLSKFWQEAYDTIAKASAAADVCFVFVAAGVTATTDPLELERTINDAVLAVSTMPDVVAMMVTDPTSTGVLMELVRAISDDATLPAIGVFNAGYSNIVVDSIVTGKHRLPYIGMIDEADYGASAAVMTRQLLDDNATPVPMCFMAHEDAQRCYKYYADLSVPDSPPFPCNATSSDIAYDIPSSVNAIFAPSACCAAVIGKVSSLSKEQNIVVGCQDYDVVQGLNYVTLQPVALQAATAAAWNNFAVSFGMAGAQSFPGLQTLVATNVYSILAT